MTVQREPRPIQAIKELRIRGSADVFVKRGEPSMTVIAEKPEDVITEIRGGVLTISQKPTVMAGVGRGGMVMNAVGSGNVQIGSVGGSIDIKRRGSKGFYRVNFGNAKIGQFAAGDIVNVGGMVMIGQPVTVEITLPNLPTASIEGSGDLSLDDVSQDAIELAITGSGGIRVSGAVKRLSVEISGSGDVKAKELQAESAELRVSGSGDIKAQATESLSARVSGSGDIKVWGNPAKRDTRVSGSGDIKFK
jgi:hypothetical protein